MVNGELNRINYSFQEYGFDDVTLSIDTVLF